MRLIILGLWKTFKWAMVLLGLVLVAMAIKPLVLPKPLQDRVREYSLAMVNAGFKGCDYSFEMEKGIWLIDAVAGTAGFILKGSEARQPVYLAGINYFRSDGRDGGWGLINERACRIEQRGTVPTANQLTAHVFLATGCQPAPPEWPANVRVSTILYGYVESEKEGHTIYLTSDDPEAVLSREVDFKRMLSTHRNDHPHCVAARK